MKFGIRRRLLFLMLSGSLLTFLFLGLPLLYGLYGIYQTIDSKEKSLTQIVSFYATDLVREQSLEKMESEAEIRAAIIGYEAGLVQEDVAYLSAELTNMLSFPNKYAAQKLPIANNEAVSTGTAYIHFSPELQNEIERAGLAPELAQEIDALSNIAVIMEPLKKYYKCICMASKNGYSICLDVADEDGTISVLSKEPWRSAFDARQRYWYQLGTAVNLPVFTKVYMSTTGEPVFSCVMPYYDAQGQVAGVLCLDCVPDSCFPVSDEAANRSFVLEAGGEILFSTLPYEMLPLEDWGRKLQDSRLSSIALSTRRMVEGRNGFRKVYLAGKDYYLSYAPVPKQSWSLGTLQDDREVLDSAEQARQRMTEQMGAFRRSFAQLFLYFAGVTVLVLLAVFALVSWGSSRAAEHFCRPLRKLVEATSEIAKGNFTHKLEVHTGDELEHLAHCMENMTRELHQYEQKITHTAQEKSRIETELTVASHIQSSFLPAPLPPCEEYQLAAAMHTSWEVGGDFYDFYYLTEDKLVLTIADVSDKGVSAALFMAVAKTILKNCMMSGKTLAEAMARANDQLSDRNEVGMFVTVFAAVLNIHTGELTYVNAGHNPPLLMSGERIIPLPPTPQSPLLGVCSGMFYEEKTWQLAVKDRLVLYTDGITEAMNDAGVLYSRQQLEKCLSLVAERANPADIIAAVLQQVRLHMGGAEQSDDMTMLVIKKL